MLLRDLRCSHATELVEKVETRAKDYIKNAKRAKERNREEEKEIKADLKTCLELGDEKVQLAMQTYELV